LDRCGYQNFHPGKFDATRMNELDGFSNRCRQISRSDGFSN
jgi:hypothetical protein